MGNRQDEFNHFQNKHSFYSESAQNRQSLNPSFSPNIKVPVEIAHSTFDFSIYKKIKMNPKIHEVLDLNWTNSNTSFQINLFTNKFWASGKLRAEISYTKGTETNIHIQNLFFSWKKTVAIEYIYPPVFPLSNEKRQYELAGDSPVTHYEQIIYNHEQPALEIVSTKVTTSKTMISNYQSAYLELHIDCEMGYRIFQNQILKKDL